MSLNVTKAAEFAAAHASGELLVLPTVWDTWSAQLAVDAGFQGLTIGSHPVANAIGMKDGEDMDFEHYMAITKAIADAVDVPVSVDVESGYGLDPRELTKKVAETGAVGMNIEDTVHREGGRLREAQEHADYIAAARTQADEMGIELVINGRTDAFKRGLEEAEGVARMKAMEAAGARSIYTVAVADHEQIARLVKAVEVPLNITTDPIAQEPGDLQTLKDLGVRRATWGPKWQAQMRTVLQNSLSAWVG